MLNNVDRAVAKESMQETVRSYQLLFAKYIYEAGTEGYLHQSFRQDHQAILGDQEIETAELPVIESFEADCQQYQVVYRSELYGTGRVNKVRMLEEQQRLSLGETVVKQLVKVVRQEFHHACDVYREIYAADLRDDGQLNDGVLEREQDRWGLGPSIVQAIASTEQSTFTTDQLEYRRVAAQSIHQTGQLDTEALRSLQLQFSFGHPLLEQLHYEVQAEFQTHLETYHQQFLDMLRHNGSIAEAEQSRLQDLRQSLGNINPDLLAEFETTAVETHEQNVVAYAEEARQVIQQFTDGNVGEPTPEEQESLQALSHWYNLSPAIAAQIERVVRAELIDQQTVPETALETTTDVTETAPETDLEATIETDYLADTPSETISEPSSGMATETATPEETAVPSIDDIQDIAAVTSTAAVTSNETVTNAEITQIEDGQVEDSQLADITEDNSEAAVALDLAHSPEEQDPEQQDVELTVEAETDVTLTSPDHLDSAGVEAPMSPVMSTEQVAPSEMAGTNTVDDESVAPLEEGQRSVEEEAEYPPTPQTVSDSIAMAETMPESDENEEVSQSIAAAHETTVTSQSITEPAAIDEDELPAIDDTAVKNPPISSNVAAVEPVEETTLASSQTNASTSGGSKKILAVGASIVAGVVLIGGAIAMFRGLGRENPVPAVDLQSNTVEIAQSGTNTVVPPEPPSDNNEATTNESVSPETAEAITAETMTTLTEAQQLIQDRQVVSGLKLLATVPTTDTTVFEVEGALRQVFQQAETYYQEGLYAEATTVVNTMGELFPQQEISEQAVIASKEWQNRWHANLATLKVAEDALEQQRYDSAIAEAQKVSHPGLQIQVATIIDTAIQAKQEQAALAEKARQNRVPPQSGSPAPRANVAPQRSAPAPRPAPRATPQPAPQPAATPSQSSGYYSPDPL